MAKQRKVRPKRQPLNAIQKKIRQNNKSMKVLGKRNGRS